MDEDGIVVCKYCGNKEYYGQLTWLNGRCECRSCYKRHYREVYSFPYTWNDKDYTTEELQELERDI
jgi:hypothetical protein